MKMRFCAIWGRMGQKQSGRGNLAVARLLVEGGARLDLEDKLWRATPLGWVQHGGDDEVARFLIGRAGDEPITDAGHQALRALRQQTKDV